MNKILAIALFLTLMGTRLLATDNTNNNTVYIAGQITNNTDSLQLVLGYWTNFITGMGKEYTSLPIPVTKGSFSFKISAPDHPFRLQMADALSSYSLFGSDQIAEAGDSVYVSANLQDQQEYSEENFKGYFKGRGAGKYNCIQALKLISDERLRNTGISQNDAMLIADSLIEVKTGVLSRFKGQITPTVYQIIYADIIGNTKYAFLKTHKMVNKLPDTSGPNSRGNNFLSDISGIPESVLALSTGYVQFLYEKSKQQIQSGPQNEQRLSNLYDKIKSKYSGKLREMLVANCLLSDLDITYWFPAETEEYTKCLKDALSYTRTDWIKEPLEKTLHTRGKGAPAFNFTLPADSSGNYISLSDLKGKVVLLDMWGYICTGCYRFANAFHQKIFPKFKDNADFAVVSIMLDPNAGMKSYQKRLRWEAGPKYTFPEYINLYAGKGQEMGRAMEEHYNVLSLPFILLIDKQGRIYSATMPFMDNPDSPNAEKIISLIQNALNEE